MHRNMSNALLLVTLVIGISEIGTTSSISGSAVRPVEIRDVDTNREATTFSFLSSGGNFSSGSNDTGVSASLQTLSFIQRIVKAVVDNKEAIGRALIVLASVSGIVLAYLLIRCVRLNKRSKSKKYGLITTLHDDNLEMKPLEEDDDEDEDMTVFERTSQKTNKKCLRKK